jgi:hypothetical protein
MVCAWLVLVQFALERREGKEGEKKPPKLKGKTPGEKRGQGVYFVKLLL